VTAFDPRLIPGTLLARDTSAVIQFIFIKILFYVIPGLRLLLFSNIHSPQESRVVLTNLAMGGVLESSKY